MNPMFLFGVRLAADTPNAEVNAGSIPTDPCVAAGSALNADLIASLPPSPLDALRPDAPDAGLAQTFAPDPAGLLGIAALDLSMPWSGPVTRDAQDIALAPRTGAASARLPDAEPDVAIGEAARTRNLLDRAREAGLSDAELARLESLLRGGAFAGPDAVLVGRLLDTRNAARALRTFVDLAAVREHHPKRIAPYIDTLSMGVGRARTDAGEGSEGILSPAQAQEAAMALAEMSSRDYDAIGYGLLSGSPLSKTNPRADSEVQAALVLKAVAARRGEFSTAELPASFGPFGAGPSPAARDVARFAGQIANVDVDELISRTTGIDPDGDGLDAGLHQAWQNGSAAAVLQMARAEVDPIHAWTLRDPARAGAVAEQQRQSILQHGGTPLARDGDSPAGDDMVAATMADAVSPSTKVAYTAMSVSDSDERRAAAASHIERALEIGIDVPIAVTSPAGDRRAMLITDVRAAGDTREFLISDPWSGRTAWVSRADLVGGNVDGSGGRLSGYWW